MKIIASSLCKVGGREYNQDYVAYDLDGAKACLVACDGLGSYIGSEDASRLCATKIIETYRQIREIDPLRAAQPAFVNSYIRSAHHFVTDYKEKTPKIKSSCTTVACAVTDGVTTTFAHIGDTRIYFFHEGKLAFQSKDHSLSQLAVETGEILESEIRNHKDQNKLTRVLGSDYYVAPDSDVRREPLSVGDAFILCSDGFWEYIFEDEMAEALTKSTPELALEKMERILIERVGKYNDNYSAVVAMAVDE